MPAIEKYGIYTDEDKYFKVPQAVWIEENAYSGCTKPYRCELSPIIAEKIEASISQIGGEWVLTLTVSGDVAEASCREVGTDRLGTPRIVEARYESPDGTPVDISLDICGERRGERIIPGAFARLSAGVNKITVWKA
jgi:hypothetical protein